MKENVKKKCGIIGFALLIISMVAFLNYKRNQINSIYTEIEYENLTNTIESNDNCYIWFFSSTCASCKKLEKDIIEVDKSQKIISNKTIFGINIDKYHGDTKKILKEYNTEGVPFIVQYNKGQIDDILYENISQQDIAEFFGESNNVLEVNYFFSPTCLNCEKVSRVMNKLQRSRKININKYNITKAINKSLLNEYCKQYGVERDIRGMVPIVFVRDKYLFDYRKISDEIVGVIDDEAAGVTKKITNVDLNIDEEKRIFKNIDLIKLISVAFLNGLNPCSFSMLFFLIVLIEADKNRILKLGCLFCCGKTIVFLLLGTVLFNIIGVLQSSIIVSLINYILIFILLVLMVQNINDYWAIKHDDFSRIKAQLPDGVRKMNKNFITKLVGKFNNSRLIYLACIGLGSLIALTEFLCSGQLYLFSIISIVQYEATFSLKAFLYLFIYCIVCVMPLLIVVFLISFGKKTMTLSIYISKKAHIIKLCYAIAFGLMAIVMVWQQIRR